MIIVSMGAGLGNQMFEYSFYTKLKKLYPDQKILFDAQYAFPPAHNGIEVFDIFGLKAEYACLKEIKKLVKKSVSSGLCCILRLWKGAERSLTHFRTSSPFSSLS